MNHSTTERTLLDAIETNTRASRATTRIGGVMLTLGLGILIASAASSSRRQTDTELQLSLLKAAVIGIIEYELVDAPDAAKLKEIKEKLNDITGTDIRFDGRGTGAGSVQQPLP